MVGGLIAKFPRHSVIQANDCYMESPECNISGINSTDCLSDMTTYTFGTTNG